MDLDYGISIYFLVAFALGVALFIVSFQTPFMTGPDWKFTGETAMFIFVMFLVESFIFAGPALILALETKNSGG